MKHSLYYSIISGIALFGGALTAQDIDRIDPKIDETIIPVKPVQPQTHFRAAHTAFKKKEFDLAATEIRSEIAVMELEAEVAAGKSKIWLVNAIGDLEDLATAVENNEIKSAEELESVFAAATHAMALHYRVKAGEAWVKNESVRAGNDLKKARGHLTRGASWTGHKFEKGAEAIMDDAVELSDKLAKGADWAKGEFGKYLEKSGKQIENFGTSLKKKEKTE